MPFVRIVEHMPPAIAILAKKIFFPVNTMKKSGLLWKEICCNSASWCNILMRFYSPLHIRAYTSGIPNLCMPCSLRSTSFSMYFVAVGAYRNGWSVYIFTWWGSGILCKPECYIGMVSLVLWHNQTSVTSHEWITFKVFHKTSGRLKDNSVVCKVTY